MDALKKSEGPGSNLTPASEVDRLQQLAKEYDSSPVRAPRISAGGLLYGVLALVGVGGVCFGLASVSAYATLKSQMDGLQADRARTVEEVGKLRIQRGEIAGQLEARQAELANVREQATQASQARELAVKALEEAQVVTLGLHPGGTGGELRLRAECATETAAAGVENQLRGVTGVFRKYLENVQQKPNPADLSGILTTGTFSRQGLLVTGRWPLERAFLANLLGGQL